jgi:hypothetical protein
MKKACVAICISGLKPAELYTQTAYIIQLQIPKWIRVTARLIDAESAKLIKEAVVDIKDKAGLKDAMKELAGLLAGK